MATELNINRGILTWAIERAGYSLEDFTIKCPRVEDWIHARKSPTVKQLEKFSNKVHLPFGYLFLEKPPDEKPPIPFFRTNNDGGNLSINVYDTILLVQRRQDWLRDYLIENEAERLSFAGKYKGSNDYREIVNDMRKTLGLNPDWAKKIRTWEESLDFLTSKIEEVGIIVNFNGVVENNTRRAISVKECRGFVLVDEIAPFMFINSADSKSAQMFTIIHELAHIWTGQSAGFDFRNMLPADNPSEKLCDKVAAEFLAPENLFMEAWRETGDIKKAARIFKISPIVAARRALDLGIYGREEFFNFYNGYTEELEARKEKLGSGGNFYATTKKRVSLRFAYHINQAVKTNKLLYRDAYKLTGLKGNTFQTFINKHFTTL